MTKIIHFLNTIFHRLFFSIIIFFFIFVLKPAYSADWLATLSIKDKALKACIHALATKNKWQNIEQVETIKCHSKGIENLNGLEAFRQLKSLSLFNNKLVHADLRAFQQLENINISNNKLTKIQLTNLNKLTTLYLFKNRLTTVDFTGLSKLNKLRITNNQLSTLDISPLVALKKAYFFNNELEDLVVKGLANLTFIELRQNPMPDEVYDRYDAIEGVTIIHDGNADDWQ